MAVVTTAVVATAAATAYSANKQADAAKDAAKAQERSAEAGISEQRLARESFEERTDPFRQVGLAAARPILSELGIAIPDELSGLLPAAQPTSGAGQVSPLFDFLRGEGFEDIQESAAAQGRLRSGGTLRDLSQFNTNLAGQFQQQRFNQLFNLLGLGSNVAAGQGTAGLQSATNISNLLGNIGQAQAQGSIGQANAVSQGISGLTGTLGAYQGGAFGGGAQPTTTQNSGGSTGFGSSGFAGTFGI